MIECPKDTLAPTQDNTEHGKTEHEGGTPAGGAPPCRRPGKYVPPNRRDGGNVRGETMYRNGMLRMSIVTHVGLAYIRHIMLELLQTYAKELLQTRAKELLQTYAKELLQTCAKNSFKLAPK